MKICIAAAQYEMGSLRSWNDYEAKITHWVEDAVSQGAQALVFPEYFSMELIPLFGKEKQEKQQVHRWAALQEALPSFLALFRQLARTHRIYILAGTFPVRVAEGFRNRAHLLSPEGAMVFQDKLQLARCEDRQMLIRPSDEIKIFDTDFGKVGINICCDIQFPLLARHQVEAGAELLLVPSYTGSLAGYHRVRLGCQARALESQCYVIQAATVAKAGDSSVESPSIGAAAVYTPVDRGFPDNGVLADGKINESRWVSTELDLSMLQKVRQEGESRNYLDWDGQYRFRGVKLEPAKGVGSLPRLTGNL